MLFGAVHGGGDDALLQGEREPAAGRGALRIVQNMPVRILYDGVSAIQCGLRTERGERGVRFLNGERGVVDDAAHADIHATVRVVDQTLMRLEHGERLRQARTVRVAFDEFEFGVHAPGDAHAHLADGVVDELALLADVGHHLFGGVGRCGCA